MKRQDETMPSESTERGGERGGEHGTERGVPAGAVRCRKATVERATRETRISATVNLDGTGIADISTGLGFLDHMLTALACHSGCDLTVHASGDLHVDDHHTVEDCAIVLGEAFSAALGTRAGVVRFASAYAPLDEALVRCVVDLVTRPHATIVLPMSSDRIGQVCSQNISHWFTSFAMSLRATLHIDLIRGENDHHKAEAAFKALALALRGAVAPRARGNDASTKGAV